MAEKERRMLFVSGGTLLVILCAIVFLVPYLLKTSYSAAITAGENFESSSPRVAHVATPEPIKAIYMTACVASTPSWREELKKLIEDTELNAVVLDIKDYTGTVSFPTENLPHGGKGCVVPDMKDFIAELHKSDIYVIGRISVFQDPFYTSYAPDLAV